MSESLGDLMDAVHQSQFEGLGTWDPDNHYWLVKETEHWRVVVIPMIFNFRICISEKRFDPVRAGYTAGWCYDKGPAAFLAALAWDPETEVRPVGWKKEAMDARGGSLL